MRPFCLVLIAFVAAPLAACGGGNLKSARDYSAPAAPPVKHPYYDPYAPYGEANARWTPPVWNRDGTVVKPYDPGVERGRPAYENAPWATGAGGNNASAPPGTF